MQILGAPGSAVSEGEITGLSLMIYNDRDYEIDENQEALLEPTDVLDVNNGSLTESMDIQDIELGSPVVITIVNHGLRTGDLVHVLDVVGTEELNGRIFTVKRLTDDKFGIYEREGNIARSVNGMDMTAYESGGTCQVCLFVYAMSDSDNEIIGELENGETELHVAQLVVTIGTSISRLEQQFEVISRSYPGLNYSG